jgi:PAS domain S-box-containing protein/diguanylate cyclase (GGDEF)-like protein
VVKLSELILHYILTDYSQWSRRMPQFDDPDFFRNVLESLQTAVYMVDRDQKVIFWNDGAERITGYLRQDVVGRSCREEVLALDESANSFVSDANGAIRSALRDGKPAVANISIRHKEGHRVLVRLRAVPIRNSHGTVIGAAESFEESLSVSEWDRRHAKLAEYGCLDENTDLPTQEFTMARLRQALATFETFRIPVSVLSIQLDQTDDFRAKFGPAAVMAILRAVERSLENSLRPTDLLGHGVNNQFLAVLSECKESEVSKVAERLRKMVGYAEIKWWGRDLTVTASFGGTGAKPGDTAESIIGRAESTLAKCVVSGGNCITISNCS